ncbi:MAG: YebC/PmpR family DNA-binding transcriptional regulator [bacterium]
MSGHNKWSKIKNKKAVSDAKKGKIYTKMAKVIAVEVKKANGDVNAANVQAAVRRAREYSVPNENIERALKKNDNAAQMEAITYEAYGPGGVAIIIDVLTDNRNKAAGEVKHILADNGSALAAPGSASWAFTKSIEDGWVPNMTVPISEEDGTKLETIIEALEDNDEVQDVYTNAE